MRGLSAIAELLVFLVSHFNLLFVLGGGLSWLPVSFLLHVKYVTLSYRIVTAQYIDSNYTTVIGSRMRYSVVPFTLYSE